MSTYSLVDLTTFATLFEFDIGTKEKQRTEVKWTGRALEAGAQTKEHGILTEDKFRVEGTVTAWPLAPVATRNPQRVISADKQLRALAKAKQPLTLITAWWAETVTIAIVEGTSDQSTGEALRMAIDCTTITIAKPIYTTIPPSALKASVRKGSTAPPNGGAAAGKGKPGGSTPKTRSWFKKLLNR